MSVETLISMRTRSDRAARNASIISAYHRVQDLRLVAEAHGVAHETVRRVLLDANEPIGPRGNTERPKPVAGRRKTGRPLFVLHVPSMVTYYKKINSIAKVAAAFGVNHRTAADRLKKAGAVDEAPPSLPFLSALTASELDAVSAPAASIPVGPREHPALVDVIRCLSCFQPFEKHWRSTAKCKSCFHGRRG